jgi:peptide/nickel transport system permease protein
MLEYAARRVPSALLVLLLASVVIFGILRLTPGNPAVVLAGPDANPATIHSIEHDLGLDQSLPAQYTRWAGGLVTGNLGHSYVLGAPIATLIGRGAGNTLELTLGAMILALLIGITLGVLGATTRNRAGQLVLLAVNTITFAVPTFISGVVLVLVFAVSVKLLPPGGQVSLLKDPSIGIQYLILPALCLALPVSAVIARFLQTSMRQVLEEEYIRAATAKGLQRRLIFLRHALPNALPPVITVLGIQVGQLLGGAVIVEAIFAWPGLGQLVLHAVLSRDYLLVQDLLMLGVFVFILLRTAAEVCQAAIDPRIRLGG